MKITKVTIQNINSLQGKHIIDFKENFSEHGLFLITGDTGSGKSTILDAICISLYGRTPRLNSPAETKYLLSLNTDSAYSEVEFEVDGVVYRSYWGIDRITSNTKNKGEIKSSIVKLDIYEENTWVSSNLHKKDSIYKEIEKITNLSFDRFTKTVMLAQGSFDAFLKAKPTEKSELLEKITGTQIYQKISQRVFEKHKIKEEEHQKLKDTIDESKLLTDEQIQEKEELILKDSDRKKSIEDQLKEIQINLSIIDNITTFSKEIENLEKKLEKLEEDKKDFLPKQAKLNNSLNAKDIYTQIVEKDSFEKELTKEHEYVSKLSDISKKLIEEEKSSALEKSKISINFEEFTKEYKEKIKIIDKAKELITIKELHTKQLTPIQEELKQKEKLETIKIEDDTQIENYINQTIEDIKELKNQKEDISLDKLYEEKKQIEQKLKNVETAKNIKIELQKNEKDLKTNQETLKISINKIDDLNKELDDIVTKIKETQELQNYRAKLKSYEEDRALLEDEKECPLCGALHHPFASDMPNIDNNLQNDIDDLTKKQTDLVKIIKKEDTEQNKIKTKIEVLKSSIVTQSDELKKLDVSLENDAKVLEISLNQTIKIIEDEKRLTLQYDQQTTKLEKLKNKKILIELIQQVKELNEKIKSSSQEIKSLLNDKDIVIYTKELESEKFEFEKSIKKIENEIQKIALDMITNTTNLKNTNENIKKIKEKIKELKNSIIALLKEKDFEDEQSVRDAYIDDKNLIETLQNEQIRLDTEDIKLKELLDNVQQKLKDEKLKDSDNTLKKEDLERQQKELTTSKDDLIKVVTLLDKEIQESAQLKIKYSDIYKKIDALKDNLIVWEKFDTLIGKADGKKYQVFVQNLTLGHLLKLANIHLRYLDERYTLQKLDDDKLSIQIVDSYYNYEPRSTNTLSGGEGFLVSLALALGLSDLVNDRIKVDSLFLDEGFGTLDEETLNTAINALEKLHLKGKSIGIISHVETLKDRIYAQIKLTKSANGYSDLRIIK